MLCLKNKIIIESELDGLQLCKKYDCKSVDDLADFLWNHHNIILIDESSLSEYTLVEAQSAKSFFDEEKVFNDLSE